MRAKCPFPTETGAVHRVFASTFGTSNYSLILLIYKLKEEEEVIHQKIQWFSAGYLPPRKNHYVEIERRVNEYLHGTSERNYGIIFLFRMMNYLFY